uniref:Uncharacterized protein n=1 Tax=Arundo donax TaxID=35708 RepID=A0A0A8YA80_ARUDO
MAPGGAVDADEPDGAPNAAHGAVPVQRPRVLRLPLLPPQVRWDLGGQVDEVEVHDGAVGGGGGQVADSQHTRPCERSTKKALPWNENITSVAKGSWTSAGKRRACTRHAPSHAGADASGLASGDVVHTQRTSSNVSLYARSVGTNLCMLISLGSV